MILTLKGGGGTGKSRTDREGRACHVAERAGRSTPPTATARCGVRDPALGFCWRTSWSSCTGAGCGSHCIRVQLLSHACSPIPWLIFMTHFYDFIPCRMHLALPPPFLAGKYMVIKCLILYHHTIFNIRICKF
jgi:hypothetical protein